SVLPHFLSMHLTSAAPAALFTLSLHDALPISPPPNLPLPSQGEGPEQQLAASAAPTGFRAVLRVAVDLQPRQRLAHRHYLEAAEDRKSTRLNSSHVKTSYAVLRLKKKNTDMTG